MKPRFIKTADGSDTLYLKSIDEHYHSTFGAIQESMHVFIDAGLRSCKASHLNIFEAGFGTGLNAWLTFLEAKKTGQVIHYFSIEKYPLSAEIYENLNYPELLKEDPAIFHQLHQFPWDESIRLSEHFILHKLSGDLTSMKYDNLPGMNLIYFDAFSPEKQPELWDLAVFKALYKSTTPDGMLVTYCAKGAVRRDLNKAGFTTERIPGPPGKREMLRAIKLINTM